MKRLLLIMTFLVTCALHAGPVKAKISSEESKVEGTSFWVFVDLELEPNWHVYAKDPGPVGFPISVDWQLPEGYVAGDLEWPEPEVFSVPGGVGRGYHNEVRLRARITPSARGGNEASIAANVKWLACSDTECLPGSEDIAIVLPVDTSEINDDLESGFDGGVSWALILAFVGGLLLNLMPCVLPVISLKIFSLVKMAGQNQAAILRQSASFTAGVVISFWVLAGGLLLLQASGELVGWGFQLQQPLFVAGMISVLFIFALSLFGMFEFGTSVSSWAGQKESAAGSFWSGVLATLVATPCTGPLLGPALGYAMTLSPMSALSIFTSLALGLASPYWVVAIWPAALKYLPKPGPWMITFKKFLGFCMLGTAAWLIWVFSAQTTPAAVIMLLCGLVFFGFASWVFGEYCSLVKPKRMRQYGLFATCTLLLVGTAVVVQSVEANEKEIVVAEGWERFSKERIEELVAEGKPVFVDFTARWCLICQSNHVVLSTEKVASAFEEKGVTKMIADWTKNDPEVTRELKRFGRNSVPLYVIYKKGKPVVLSQTLTPEMVAREISAL